MLVRVALRKFVIQFTQFEFHFVRPRNTPNTAHRLSQPNPKQGGQDSYHEGREKHEGVLRVEGEVLRGKMVSDFAVQETECYLVELAI